MSDLILYLNDEPIGCTTNHTVDLAKAPICRATGPSKEVTMRVAPVYEGTYTVPKRTLTKRVGRQRKAKKLFNWTCRTGLHTPKQVKLSLRYLKWILTTHKQTRHEKK